MLYHHQPHLIRHFDLAMGIARRWLQPDQILVGWILIGDEDDGFTRVCGLLPHAGLRQLGTNSVILRKCRPAGIPLQLRNEDIQDIARVKFDVIVFLNVEGAGSLALIESLRAVGTKTIYAAGDLVTTRLPEVVDYVVVASEGQRAIAPSREAMTEVIEPVIDAPPNLVKDYSRRHAREEIRVVWVGYPENLHLLEPVREALRSPSLSRYRLVTISRGPEVTYQWDRKHVHRQLIDCDVAVLPSSSTEWYTTKPNTRMTMFKSLGIPIIASPNPAFAGTLTHGVSCYFARTVEDWIAALEKLGNFEHRAAIGLTDRQRIVDIYGRDAIARRWRDCFERLIR